MESLEKKLVSKLVEVKTLFDNLLNEVIMLKTHGQGNAKDIKDILDRVRVLEGQINVIISGLKSTSPKNKKKSPLFNGSIITMLLLLFLALKDYMFWFVHVLKHILHKILD